MAKAETKPSESSRLSSLLLNYSDVQRVYRTECKCPGQILLPCIHQLAADWLRAVDIIMDFEVMEDGPERPDED